MPPTRPLKSFRYFVSNFLVMIFLFLAKVIVKINKDTSCVVKAFVEATPISIPARV